MFFQVLFDTSKKELLNPNQGYKKFVMKLKQRYDVSLHSLQCLARLAGSHQSALPNIPQILAILTMAGLFGNQFEPDVLKELLTKLIATCVAHG